MSQELDKNYNPDQVEERIYDAWIATGAFAADTSDDDAETFSGSLHRMQLIHLSQRTATLRVVEVSEGGANLCGRDGVTHGVLDRERRRRVGCQRKQWDLL